MLDECNLSNGLSKFISSFLKIVICNRNRFNILRPVVIAYPDSPPSPKLGALTNLNHRSLGGKKNSLSIPRKLMSEIRPSSSDPFCSTYCECRTDNFSDFTENWQVN